MIGLYDRDGHLSELALHRSVSGELAGAEAEQLHAHAAACAPCGNRLETAREAAAAPLPAWIGGAPTVIPLPRRTRPAWIPWAGGIGLLAAAAAIFTLRTPPPETFTARGESLRLEVYRDAPAGAERLGDGASVRGGDRLGFRVASAQAGHLVVAGVDEAGSVYPVWPREGAPSGVVESAPEGTQLDAAVQLDATPGAERLVAVRCPGPIAWNEVSARLAAARTDGKLAFDGCALDEVRLVRAP